MSRPLFVAALLLGAALVGCQSAPRVDLPAGVVFRAVGPDGGTLDEPDALPASLTLAQAIRRAVLTDPQLQSSIARFRMALADTQQARLLPNPVLSIALRWGAGSTGIEASLTQEIIAAVMLPRRASAADHRLRQAGAAVMTAALDVIRDVQEQYVKVQASEALMPVLLERQSLLVKLAETAKARLDAGEGTRADLVSLDAQRVLLQVEIDEASLQQRGQCLALARLLGEPSSTATWTLEPWTPPSDGGSEAAWIESALSHRPEIEAIAWQLKALGDDKALTRLLPWDGTEAGVNVERDGDWTEGPGVSVPLPIFDWGQARRTRIAAEQQEARHDLTLARRKAVEEVRIAHHAFTAGRANLARLRDELLPLQQQRRKLAEDAYRAGQTDVTALYFIEQETRATEAKKIELEQQAALAWISLQRAAGSTP